MGRKKPKRYSAQFKFTVVLEALKGEKAEGEIAGAYEVHPVTLSRWKKQFMEYGAEVFGGSEEVKTYEARISQVSHGESRVSPFPPGMDHEDGSSAEVSERRSDRPLITCPTLAPHRDGTRWQSPPKRVP
jgi:hypothetical protein